MKPRKGVEGGISLMENGIQDWAGKDNNNNNERRTELNMFISVVGIYGCYMLSGFLQEAIYVYRAEDGGKFIYTCFLLWIQCIVNVCFTFVSSKIGKYALTKPMF